MAESGIQLLHPAKKARLSATSEKCVVCHTKRDEEGLVSATSTGIQKIIAAANQRCDNTLTSLTPSTLSDEIKWHANCYKSYTSKTNVSRVVKRRLFQGKKCSFEDLDEFSGTDSNQHVTVGTVLNQHDTVGTFSDQHDTTGTISNQHDNVGKSVSVWNRCIICQKLYHKKDKSLSQILSFDTQNTLLEAAEARCDNELLSNIKNVNLVEVEAKYHRGCYMSYTSKHNLFPKLGNIQEEENDLYEKAFIELTKEIDEDLENGKAFSIMNLLTRFQTILSSYSTSGDSYRTYMLKRRLIKHYGKRIVIQKSLHKKRSDLIFSSTITMADAVEAARNLNDALNAEMLESQFILETDGNEKEDILFHASQILKSDIKCCKNVLPVPLNSQDLTLETAAKLIPKSLYFFLKGIMGGTQSHIDTEDDTGHSPIHRQILSVAQDIVHIAFHGEVKTPKHLALGISVKHLTGSKQLITLLNRLGHVCSYDEVERQDTAIAQCQLDVLEENDGIILPTNIYPGTFVQAAADNDDFNEDTLDGRQTTHATTLVLYQRKKLTPVGKFASDLESKSKPRRRALQETTNFKTLLRYNQSGVRSNQVSLLGHVNTSWYKETNGICDKACSLDLAWILCRLCPIKLYSIDLQAVKDQKVPGWSAFNAIVSENNHPVTNIGYCPILPESPTQYNTVYTLMTNVQNMMRKLGQDVSVLTLDEAIYSKAKEIQWNKKDEFCKMIIRMGGFHLALVFLASIGKLYENSGLDDILIESGLYGISCVNHIMHGKSYSRGVRAHKIVAEALERLLWQEFSSWKDLHVSHSKDDINCEKINDLLQKCHKGFSDIQITNEELKNDIQTLAHCLPPVLTLMNDFKTERAEKSDTFAFWIQYLEMITTLLQFIRAEREGIWELHLNSVVKMIPYFFAMDRTNYARWASVYIADMKMLPVTAPMVHKEFLEGNHPVKRSSKKFNQIWTDMALEQSVNRDSKTKGGVVGFTKKPGALDRWFITAHERAAITSSLKVMCGLSSELTEHLPHKEGMKNRTDRDEKDVQNVIHLVREQMSNPFKQEEGQLLTNIATGVVMPANISKSLMSAKESGSKAMLDFVENRLNAGKISVFAPIKKMKISTFRHANELQKRSSHTSENEKLLQISSDRELFSRIVIAAKVRNINLKDVFKYELSSTPSSLSYTDGTLRKATKSSFLKELEKRVPPLSRLPDSVTNVAWVFDAMGVIQMMGSAGVNTFGQLSEAVLDFMLNHLKQNDCHRIDIVFDRYDIPHSIKAFERARRENVGSLDIKIHGFSTPLPKQWSRYISSSSNKASLINFLCNSWVEAAPKKLGPGDILVVAGGFSNPDVTKVISCENIEDLPSLKSNHEEADTRILLHASHIAKSNANNIVIWSPDTDVAVLCIHFYKLLKVPLWFRTGVKEHTRFIPIHDLVASLGTKMCNILPGLHALTGCDSTSAISKVGKVKPLKLVQESYSEFKELESMGKKEMPEQETVDKAKLLVARMFDKTVQHGNLNDLRHKLFCKKQSRNEALPPTDDSMEQHLKRANYQTLVWKAALKPCPKLPSPVGNGWHLKDGCFMPTLMKLDPAPKALMLVVTCSCTKSECRGRCGCSSEGLPCCEACSCGGEENCQNPAKQNLPDSDESDDEE